MGKENQASIVQNYPDPKDAAQFALVVAHDQTLGIGKNNGLPWKLPKDMRYFRELTTKVANADRKNAVIMGRKTWQSIPDKFRPLPDRYNIVLTRGNLSASDQSTFFCQDFGKALELLNHVSFANCFVIGGAQIYQQALQIEKFDRIYATEIFHDFDCDTKLPEYRHEFLLVDQSPIEEENNYRFRFNVYKRLPQEIE